MVMNRVAKRKPRGDLRTCKEASERAVHFEVSDPIQPPGPCQMNGPALIWVARPKLPAFAPVRTFQWGEVRRKGAHRVKGPASSAFAVQLRPN